MHTDGGGNGERDVVARFLECAADGGGDDDGGVAGDGAAGDGDGDGTGDGDGDGDGGDDGIPSLLYAVCAGVAPPELEHVLKLNETQRRAAFFYLPDLELDASDDEIVRKMLELKDSLHRAGNGKDIDCWEENVAQVFEWFEAAVGGAGVRGLADELAPYLARAFKDDEGGSAGCGARFAGGTASARSARRASPCWNASRRSSRSSPSFASSSTS